METAVERLEKQRDRLEIGAHRSEIVAALQDYVEWRRIQDSMAPRTEETIRFHVGRFSEFSGLRFVQEVTLGEIERFYRHLQNNVSEHTAQKYIYSLRGLF
ncbi:MAG: hypothetical protein AAF514_13015, partial [Verrucomicrobiota bacterium]